MKTKSIFSLFAMLTIIFPVMGQIQVNTNSKVEKGTQENYLLKKEGKNDKGDELISVGNAKNKWENEPLVIPQALRHPGYDNPSIFYRVDFKAIRSLIAPIILAKTKNDEELLMIDYYFTPDGIPKEVVFVTNESTGLSVRDFEKMEKAILTNVRISPRRSDFNPFKGVPFVKISDMFRVVQLREL
ncbi:hypothetical protein [Olivibacter domesticus]|uniref:TonB protein C-terminal n=1 Tax=Olivibacter domesticus TaxID=407022 RepID=A0A1H7KNG7_OLID1|nr:hypothetical protein [Olivibacter domesticus]SEK87487.1 hypothetical protein SAMN05661044_01391 [Olivibacter domesticus]